MCHKICSPRQTVLCILSQFSHSYLIVPTTVDKLNYHILPLYDILIQILVIISLVTKRFFIDGYVDQTGVNLHSLSGNNLGIQDLVHEIALAPIKQLMFNTEILPVVLCYYFEFSTLKKVGKRTVQCLFNHPHRMIILHFQFNWILQPFLCSKLLYVLEFLRH